MPQRVVEMATRVLTYVGVEAVGHQLKLPVGGDEGDGAVVLEARQTDTLVELHVLQLHGFTLPSCRRRIRQPIRETQPVYPWLFFVFGEMFFVRRYYMYCCCTHSTIVILCLYTV